jgi:flagellar basal body rod protein FlgC
METPNSQAIRVETFETREQVEERVKNLQFSLQPGQEYDPEDPNADETGYVWVAFLLPSPDADKLYLCTDGYLR